MMSSPANFCVRRATRNDAADIARIHVDSWRTAYRGMVEDAYLDNLSYEDRTARWLMEGKSRLTMPDPCAVFVAHDANKLLGFADIGPAREATQDNQIEIGAMYMDPNHMRQGIGHDLFDTCVNYAKAQGFDNMIITVMEKNKPAQQFYENIGGAPMAEKMDLVAGKEEKLIIYHWPTL